MFRLEMNVDIANILATNELEAFSTDVQKNIEYAVKRGRHSKKSCHRVDRQDLFIFSNGETTFCDTDYICARYISIVEIFSWRACKEFLFSWSFHKGLFIHYWMSLVCGPENRVRKSY